MPLIRRIALALCGLAALAPAAAAAGTVHYEKRTFAVTAQGVQLTRSGYVHPSGGRCDPAAKASASERIVFHSTKPKIIDMTDFDPLVLVGHGRPQDHVLAMAATVTRHSSYKSDPLDPTCQGAGGGGKPIKPDCGTRRLHLPLDVDWYNPIGLQLKTPELKIPDTPFTNCPVDGLVFPYILDSKKNGKPIIAAIPAADLFNRKWKKHILLGGGKFSSYSMNGGYSTSIHWTITLRAVHPR